MLTPSQARILAEDLMEKSAEMPAAPLPDRIGSYRIRGVIGVGGMGTVYEAEQEHPRRIVALKVLNRGIASKSALRRFEHEAEMLAHLQHPGIAHIYEAGTHGDGNGGVPYFVMEYVPGAKNIVEYAESAGLSTRQRLGLFARVCDAVHHGHQKGIIHRDLKPANILVGEEPHKAADGIGGSSQPEHMAVEGGPGSQSPARDEQASRRVSRRSAGEEAASSAALVKIIDFGVARATDSDIAVTTMQTDVGRLIGTLQYMSPEQCEGDPRNVDTRSDVYSLGVVLYELLCGRLPYDVSSSSIAHAARTIQDEQPIRPSTIIRKLRGDIEIITLKALEKDREKRYQSAAELAADIRRHLTGQPIEAKPPTAWTRFSRWIARHPIAATTAACLVIGLIVTPTIVFAISQASVQYIIATPHHIELLPNGREARLVSINGRILHTWSVPPAGKIGFAELVERPQEFGGGSLALIAYADNTGHSQYPSLWVYDINQDCDHPIWDADLRPAEIESCPRDRAERPSHFAHTVTTVCDVFPEHPGQELVCRYVAAGSGETCVRVLDLRGQVLFSFWHRGTLPDCYWMADAGLLVFLGSSMEPTWEELQIDATPTLYPLVLFAVRPELNRVNGGWIGYSDAGGGFAAEWCRCVWPPESYAVLGDARFALPATLDSPGRNVWLQLEFGQRTRAGLNLLIDEHGNEVGTRRVISDEYSHESRIGNVPDHSEIGIQLLPVERQ